MSNSEMTVATITITRVLSDEGDLVYCLAEDNQGETLSLVEALGMLRMAEDIVIRAAMGEIPDDEEEDGECECG